MPFLILLFLFFALEIGLFIEWGGEIGVAMTLLLIVLTAVGGVQLIRWTGFGLLRELQGGLVINRWWLQARQQAVVRRLLGGLLLILPGFATDILGLVFVLWSLIGPAGGGRGPGGGGQHDASHPRHGGTVVDGEYEPAERPRDRLDR